VREVPYCMRSGAGAVPRGRNRCSNTSSNLWLIVLGYKTGGPMPKRRNWAGLDRPSLSRQTHC
jgi:hypothetical protein